MRKEFLQLNAQLSDIKKIEKELANIEVLQVNTFVFLGMYYFI